MITLQEYLDQQYPTQSEKEQLMEIVIGGGIFNLIIFNNDTLLEEKTEQLAGTELDLSPFPNLKKVTIDADCLKTKLDSLEVSNCSQLTELVVAYNHLTTLDLSHCQQLESLWCANNYLTQITYPAQPQALTKLDIRNNNLSETDCSVFSGMKNLVWLWIGNWDKNRIQAGIYNHWSGSLAPLQNCTKLYSLDISQTDLDRGLEYLPASCETIYCANTPLEPYLKDFKKASGGCDYSKWRQANLSLIEQLQENSELLDSITILDSSLAHNNLTPELTRQEKVLQVLRFYLEEENQATRKQLYQAQELVNQVQ